MDSYEEVGGRNLGRALNLLNQSFTGEPKAFIASMIRAMSLVVFRYGKGLEDERVIGSLAPSALVPKGCCRKQMCCSAVRGMV